MPEQHALIRKKGEGNSPKSFTKGAKGTPEPLPRCTERLSTYRVYTDNQRNLITK